MAGFSAQMCSLYFEHIYRDTPLLLMKEHWTRSQTWVFYFIHVKSDPWAPTKLLFYSCLIFYFTDLHTHSRKKDSNTTKLKPS